MIETKRKIQTKMIVGWSGQNCEYIAKFSKWPFIRGEGRTPEEALLALSIEFHEFSEDLILEGNQA